ncbi:hypothetical protein N9B05_04430 [Mariniblastus sp.]|nr:hypothetical protein [Mariniblastus sp.]
MIVTVITLKRIQRQTVPAMERELTTITTRSLLGATASLTPCNHFVALLICDATTIGTQEITDFARSLIASGCSYFCCWGPDCERVHDIFDEEFVNDGTNTETIMTTWHASETLEEFATFALLNTEPTQSFRATTNSTVAIVIDDYISVSRMRAALVATP